MESYLQYRIVVFTAFCLVILSHKVVLFVNQRLGNLLYAILVFLIYLLCLFVFSMYGEEYIMHISRTLWLLLMCFYMLVPFSFGVLAFKIHSITIHYKVKKVSNLLLLGALAVVIIIQCCLAGSALGVLYQIPYFCYFILICSNITVSKTIGKVLESLGKYSLSMWFIHSYAIISLVIIYIL